MISQALNIIGNFLIIKDFLEFINDKIKTKTDLRTVVDDTISLSELFEDKNTYKIFSLLNDEQNLKEMEVYFKESSSYELENIIKSYIIDFVKEIHLEESFGEKFANLFFEIYIQYLKKENKEEYDKYILGKKIDDLKKEISYKTLKEMENNLKENTVFPFKEFNLDFFNYEDEDFSKQLKEKIKNNEKVIYIEGITKEETLYCVLSELKRINPMNKDIYIFTEEKEWKKCSNQISNAILIPYFYSSEIFPIQNNINIFVFNKYESCFQKNKITLKRRLRKNLQEKLNQFYIGKDTQYIYNLIKKTNGIFSNLKKIILNAHLEPKWLKEINNSNFDIIEKALFLIEWSDKDKTNISSLIEMEYDEFIKKINPLINLEEAFLIKIELFNSEYRLAYPEEAWSYLVEKISEKSWKTHKQNIIDILSEIDNLYKKELKFELFIETDEDRKYSKKLKSSLLKSLVLYKNTKASDSYSSSDINNIIDSIFENIIQSKIPSINKWAYISEHILLITEIAPSVVMKRLENELNTNTGLIDLMKTGEHYNSFGTNYYVYYLWAIEYLVQYEETAIRAIRWLLKINDLDINYSISNSPKETLKHIFNTWHNEVFLTTEQKIQLAELAIKNYKNGWDIIINEIPKPGTTLIGELSKPMYTSYINELPPIDMIEITKSYLKLCIENAKENDILKLLDFLEPICYFNLWQNMTSILEKIISEWTDEKKEELKFKLRTILFNHRFFKWNKLPLKILNNIEDLYNKITFENDIWSFAFLFRNDSYNFPLLNPTPFEDKENYFQENDAKTEELKRKEFQKFKDSGYDFVELLALGIVKDFYLFGKYVAEFYSKNKYDEIICKKILNSKNKEFILSYAIQIYNSFGNEELKKIINLLIKVNVSNDLVAYVTNLQVFDKNDQNNLPIIDTLNENIQEFYWKNNRINCIKNKETITYVIENLIKYENAKVFEYLAEDNNYISEEEYIEYLIKIQKNNNFNINNIHLIKYYLEKIFNKIYKKYYQNSNDLEMYRKIASLELYYREILPWDNLKCFVYLLKKEPYYYAEMINIIYKHEDENEEKVEKKQNLIDSLFNFYYKLNFCPCTHNTNNIKKEELEEWVNKFKSILEKQNQRKLFGMTLGKVFAFSPQGNDGFYPHESIRCIIEDLNNEDLKSLKNNYIITILNKRGVYSPDAGITEAKLAKEYKENADRIRLFFPFSASIYDEISNSYEKQSQLERKRAEYEL